MEGFTNKDEILVRNLNPGPTEHEAAALEYNLQCLGEKSV
jgi:hypothetical protein